MKKGKDAVNRLQNPELEALNDQSSLEQKIWNICLKSISQYGNTEVLRKMGVPLTTESAAFCATVRARVFESLIYTIFKDDHSTKSISLRAVALARQLLYLELSSRLRWPSREAPVLSLGCGTAIADLLPLRFHVDEIKSRQLLTALARDESAVIAKNLATIITDIQPDVTAVDTLHTHQFIAKQLSETLPFTPVVMDATAFLRQSAATYPLITLFRLDPRMIEITFAEFAQLLYDHLQPEGQVILTVGSGFKKGDQAQRIHTLQEIANVWPDGAYFFQRNSETPGCQLWTNGSYMDIATAVLTRSDSV